MPHLLTADPQHLSLLPEYPLPLRQEYGNGIKVLWRAGSNHPLLNIVDGSLLTRYAVAQEPVLSGTSHGLGHDVATTSIPIYAPTTSNAAVFSVLVGFYPTSTGATRGIFEWNSRTTPGSTGPRLLIQANNADLRAYWQGGYRITSTGDIIVGQFLSIVARYDGSTLHFYSRGRKLGSYTSAASNGGDWAWWGSGYAATALGRFPIGAWWEADIGEIASLALSENPANLYEPEPITIYWPAAAGGGDTSITPANGSTTLVGYAPSLISPQSITPAAGGLSITGLASALSTAFSLTPDVGTLSIQGYAPSLAQNFSISPDTGALSLLGSAPGLIQGFLLTPDTGSLALSGYAPSLGTAGSINPSDGTLTLVGYQPGVTQQTFIVPGAGTLTLTGLSPSVAGAGTLIPSESNLTLVGYQPGVTQQTFIVPGVGAIAVETHAPLLVGNTYVVPGVGAATFAGYAPTVGLGTIVTPGAGQILLAGGTPSVVTDSGSSVITPASGSLGFIGYAPTSLTAVFVAGNGRVFWLPAQSVEWVLRAQSTEWILR